MKNSPIHQLYRSNHKSEHASSKSRNVTSAAAAASTRSSPQHWSASGRTRAETGAGSGGGAPPSLQLGDTSGEDADDLDDLHDRPESFCELLCCAMRSYDCVYITSVRVLRKAKIELRLAKFFCPRRNIIPTQTIIQGGWVSLSSLSSL